MSGRNEEVERRFLVRSDAWRGSGAAAQHVVQGYLNTDPARVVRVRLAGDRGWLTVKGAPRAGGARLEIECDIPAETARAILSHPGVCMGTVIEKERTAVRAGDLTWEIDEFGGRNAGLRIAEVEYDGALPLDEWHSRIDAQRPAWLGAEITAQHRFSNNALAEVPFDAWPAAERSAVGQGRLPDVSSPARS